ncbi:MAG TPA: EAL domain-containing protein [Actinomycetota bacterium]|nr:EAL domain-containing protein [Actinomycetota bacterium]
MSQELGSDVKGTRAHPRPPAADPLRLLAARFPGAFWIVDSDLHITHAMGSLLSDFGLTSDGVIGKPMVDELARRSDPPPGVLEAHRNALAGTATSLEIVAADGRPMHVQVEPLMEGDRVVGAVGLAVDITERKRAEDSAAFLASVSESSGDAILAKTLDGTILTWNAGAERIYGYRPIEAVGRNISMLIPPDRADEFAMIRERLKQGERLHFETERVRKDGQRIDVELTVSPIPDPSGEVHAASVIAREITDRKRADEALRISEARNRALLESSLDCVIAMDEQGRITEFNPAAEQTFGYTRAEVIGHDMADLIIPPAFREQHRQGLARYLNEGVDNVLGRRLEMTAMRKDGTELPVELTVTRVNLPGPALFLGTVRDISERRQTEEKLAHLAFHDKLTDLPNRQMFEEHLDLALARAKRAGRAVAVLYLDLDNFKLVNDSLGHTMGDELIRQVAHRLRDAARDTDLVARHGGDEFLMLLADLDPDENGHPDAAEVARSVAARVHECLHQPFIVADTEFFVSTSVGISLYPLHAEDRDGLMRTADSAMYQSKWSAPGGSVVFIDEPGGLRSQLSLATELRKAVKERQWALHYQPIVGLEDGSVVAVEALLRWRHPEGRLVAPGEFLALAEEMGLVEEIGRWVLREVGRQTQYWRREGLDLMVAVNLSARQLWRREAATSIPEEIADAGADLTRVVLEVTESTAMNDTAKSFQILTDLREQGALVAIDDFGTGYSSLSRLKELPVQILKIDRSFVSELPGDTGDAAMVNGLITLAENLGMEPIAEGIETEEQRRFLLENGCHIGQGFLFSRPVPAAELQKRLTVGTPTPTLLRQVV